jgi:hypothetical protein
LKRQLNLHRPNTSVKRRFPERARELSGGILQV